MSWRVMSMEINISSSKRRGLHSQQMKKARLEGEGSSLRALTSGQIDEIIPA